MNFVQTEEQAMITASARKLFGDTCSTEGLRKMLAAGLAHDPTRWAQVCEMGLIAILAPEAAGGMGMGASDFVGIAEAAGYVALPEPVVELSGVVVPLLAELESDGGWLERVLSGTLLAIGHPQQRLVANAVDAEALILADGDDLHIVERAQVELSRQETLDPFRRLYRVEWKPTPRTRMASGAGARLLWVQAFERGALFTAAQCLGLAQRCVDLGVAYARDRVQFGKPIGSYQAVKHMLASVQVQIEFARPVLYAAAAELSIGGPVAAARVSHAKLAAAEAADLSARTALQVYGAMGMTWEVDLHFFLKRALALNSAWGVAEVHRRRVVDRMFNAPIGPDAVFAAELA